MQTIISYPNLWVTMQRRRLKQFDLASILKCSSSTISQKLRGILPLTAAEKELVSRALGLPVIWLFSEAIFMQSVVENTMANLDHVEKR